MVLCRAALRASRAGRARLGGVDAAVTGRAWCRGRVGRSRSVCGAGGCVRVRCRPGRVPRGRRPPPPGAGRAAAAGPPGPPGREGRRAAAPRPPGRRAAPGPPPAVAHRHRRGPVQGDDRGRGEGEQHVVERHDLRPVGGREVRGLVVQRGDGGLHAVRAGGPPVSAAGTRARPSSIIAWSQRLRSWSSSSTSPPSALVRASRRAWIRSMSPSSPVTSRSAGAVGAGSASAGWPPRRGRAAATGGRRWPRSPR